MTSPNATDLWSILSNTSNQPSTITECYDEASIVAIGSIHVGSCEHARSIVLHGEAFVCKLAPINRDDYHVCILGVHFPLATSPPHMPPSGIMRENSVFL